MGKGWKMKKILALLILLMGLVFPWACSDNHSPSTPSAPTLGTGSTPTGSITPGTYTSTPTLVVGANTFTPTPTFAIPVPAYQNNYSLSAAPRGMVIDGGILTVAESELKPAGLVTELEEFTGAGTAVLNIGAPPNISNLILTGCPPLQTPGATPVPFIPIVTALNQVQGYVNPGGQNGAGAWTAILDLNSSGGATLYAGYIADWSSTYPPMNNGYVPFTTVDYGGVPFKNPQAMCDDGAGTSPTSGHMYIADTGNGTVDELDPYEGVCPLVPLPFHRWYGAAGVAVGGTGAVFKSAAVSFRSPTAVTCDTSGNVWVGDQGYSPSYIQEFTSGATTILESWQGVAGCVVSGLAVNSGTGNVYVADSGNKLVEVYSPTGTLLAEVGDPGPLYHTLGGAYVPSCIGFSGGFVYVGDTGNDQIDVFQ